MQVEEADVAGFVDRVTARRNPSCPSTISPQAGRVFAQTPKAMNDVEIANLTAKHASEMRNLEHRLKNELFADALDLAEKVQELEAENKALAHEVEKLTREIIGLMQT
jgi:hypothetical protein